MSRSFVAHVAEAAARIARKVETLDDDYAVCMSIVNVRNPIAKSFVAGWADGIVVVARGAAADRVLALIGGEAPPHDVEVVRLRPQP